MQVKLFELFKKAICILASQVQYSSNKVWECVFI